MIVNNDVDKSLVNCLNLITILEIKDFTRKILSELPDYFFKIAASSTGKYHPKFASGEGGLIRHTVMAVNIANELLNLEMYKSLAEEKDFILSALILHDGLKHGLDCSPNTVFEHPILISDFIKTSANGSRIALKVASLVETHMGQWNTNKYSKIVLKKPETKQQKFVHQCDYLASRKFFDINDGAL